MRRLKLIDDGIMDIHIALAADGHLHYVRAMGEDGLEDLGLTSLRSVEQVERECGGRVVNPDAIIPCDRSYPDHLVVEALHTDERTGWEFDSSDSLPRDSRIRPDPNFPHGVPKVLRDADVLAERLITAELWLWTIARAVARLIGRAAVRLAPEAAESLAPEPRTRVPVLYNRSLGSSDPVGRLRG